MAKKLIAIVQNDCDDDEDAQGNLKSELLQLLGPEGYLLLLEQYSGIRLYVPRLTNGKFVSKLVDDITIQHAKPLMQNFPGLYIRVPLDRDFRIRAYREMGFSNRKIARLVGMAENGLEKAICRLNIPKRA